MPIQNYEEYWKLTNAYTDYDGEGFLKTLSICVNFIDEFLNDPYSVSKYEKLQNKIREINPIDLISIRKSINQLVKMGFINPFLISYHPHAKDYIEAKTNKKRKILLSKIIYSNSGFNKAVNRESSIREINFLIQTLIEKGSLSKEEIVALMLVDIEQQEKSFIGSEDLQQYVVMARETCFMERKYNQIGYLYNLLGKLDDLVFVENSLYFKDDAHQIFGEDLSVVLKKRDPYLHRLYKNQLREECEGLYKKTICVLEKLSYPVLIASHIKPFIESDENEAYDHNNGLLLSKTVDSLFDLKYISFSDDGVILFSKRTSPDVVDFWKKYRLDPGILNEKRKMYLKHHRSLMEEIDQYII